MSDLARPLAQFVVSSSYHRLPAAVQHEGKRTFLNWLGCVLGGCHDRSVTLALAVLRELGGQGQALVIGRDVRLDMGSAAFLNATSANVHSYNDTHLKTVCHPTGPVAAAIFAFGERNKTSGADFLTALVAGIEVECRMSLLLTAPPARCPLGLNMTGFTGGFGAAAAVGRLLGLNQGQIVHALGIAATHASGLREGNTVMSGKINSAQAARSGLTAALLAAKGFTSSDTMLEGPTGFAHVFATEPNFSAALDGLGHQYEVLNNMPKPFPCGIVIHPVIDACLRLTKELDAAPEQIERVELVVPSLALELTGIREPRTAFDAQCSLYHLAAVTLLYGKAGLSEMSEKCVHDPTVIKLRRRVLAMADPTVAKDEAKATVFLNDGRAHAAHVLHCRGSRENPMTDAELEDKFREQSIMGLPSREPDELIDQCWEIDRLDDVGRLARLLG
jgi:2-methylcitrate dehydratase PrpD